MINYRVPFYSNTPDDTHCVQAAFKMVAEYFRPDLVLGFDEWDNITHKKKDGWTWTMAGLIWFKENNFDVVDIEPFSYPMFISSGKEYLRELFGDEIANIQDEKSNLMQEQEISKEFIKTVRVEERKPDLDEVRDFLQKGYLVSMNVNASTLNGKEGYAGHFIVITGHDDTGFIFNDPGLPPVENRHVAYSEFVKAWAFPNENALNLIAIRG